jgi:two-component system chemotaxis response regulator CheV
MQADNQTNILLESGTNELEVVEFTINKELFGINVSKVKEIMMVGYVKPMPKAHPVVEGVFKPRDQVIPVIDLTKYLDLPPSEQPEKDVFIVASFNNMDFAFHVHTVVGIDRISWAKLQKPDQIIYGGSEGVATAIAEFNDRLITILDFEKIVSEISPQTSIKYEDLDKLDHKLKRTELPVLVVEDSGLLSKMIIESLHRAGYQNTIKLDNGQEAWDFMEKVKASGEPPLSQVACVVSDIEMPQMDGHRFTKLLKDDPVLKEVPLILFSSLINEEMRNKGKLLGADAQISKPEIAELVHLIDEFTGAEAPE